MAQMQPTSPGVLIYGGRTYAVGMIWFTVQDEEAVKALLKNRLRSLGSDFYCSRLHISQQQGFGTLKQGHKRGMPVAAAIVADQLVGEWHGVFEADNGWWYVQVRSDTVMPHGDRFYLSEEEAYNVFQEEMTKHNWPHAYAPGKWRLPEGTSRELSLKNLLGGLDTSLLTAATMTARFGGAKQRNVVFGALCAIVLLLAGIVLKTIFMQPEINTSQSSRQVRPVIKPVAITGTIDTKQLIEMCGQSVSSMAVPLPGWRMSKFSCSPTIVTFLWASNGGTLEGAKEYGFKKWPKTVNVSLSTGGLLATITPDKLPTLEATKLSTQEEALLILERELKPMGQLKIKPSGPGAALAKGAKMPIKKPMPVKPGAKAVPPPPPKPQLEVDFASGFDPREVGPYLIGRQGLEVLKIDWDIAKGVWLYKIKWMNAAPIIPAANAVMKAKQVGGQAPATAPAKAVPGVAGKVIPAKADPAAAVAPAVPTTPTVPDPTAPAVDEVPADEQVKPQFTKPSQPTKSAAPTVETSETPTVDQNAQPATKEGATP